MSRPLAIAFAASAVLAAPATAQVRLERTVPAGSASTSTKTEAPALVLGGTFVILATVNGAAQAAMRVDSNLFLAALVIATAAQAVPPMPPELARTTWRWISLTTPEETLTIAEPGRYIRRHESWLTRCYPPPRASAHMRRRSIA
jgi:hypothetical protein